MGFRLNVVIRVLVVIVTGFLAPVFIYVWHIPILAVIFAVLSLTQLVFLIEFVEKTNRDLSRFLQAIRYDDFTASFSSKGLGRSFNELASTFSQVQRKFRQTRIQTEEQYQYLQTIVQHVAIGILVFRESGKVDLVNNAAKRIFQMASLRDIHTLECFSKELVNAIREIQPGENRLVKIDDRNISLALSTTELRIRNQRLKVISLQNIRGELEENELAAWQNLIRVLTHEIMNSMTPISSLAATILEMIQGNQATQESQTLPQWDREEIDEICNAISTIQNRSQSLMDLIHAYRNMALIPRPDFSVFEIRGLFEKVVSLLEPSIESNGVTLETQVQPSSLELTADPSLVEQVLINLMLNAIDATKDVPDPTISLKAGLNDDGRIIIAVVDNGHGIAEETCKKVFTPFFTTKKKGSGIGLSFSKQIMLLHHGSISVDSVPEDRTTFRLRF